MVDRTASDPRNQSWKRRAQLSHDALSTNRLRSLIRWLLDHWNDERPRIVDELPTGHATFPDWLCMLARAVHDALLEGARLPEAAGRATGLRSLQNLLTSGAAGDVEDLEACLWVVWLWARGADERTKPATLKLEATRMGYRSTLTLKNLLGDAAGARAVLRPEFPELWPAPAGRTADGQREDAPYVPLLFVEPMPAHGLVGRDHKLAELGAMLTEDGGVAGAARTLVLRGMGGIGKTTLAVALARDPVIGRRFPDGAVWTALGPRPNVRTLQHRWGRALQVDLSLEPDPRACTDALRSALERKRMLLVVDDVWDPLPAAAFHVAGERSAIVFTTRDVVVANALTTPDHVVRVDVLEEAAATALLRKLIPTHADLSERDAKKLVGKLERLPLAIVLAGKFLASQADVPGYFDRMMGELVERREARLRYLRDERGRLGLSETEPASLQAILGMSVDRLERTDCERFAMASVLGGDPLTWDTRAAAAAWDCSVEAAEETTSRLIQHGLIERRGERYWMHALLADHAADLLARGLDHL